LEPDDAVDSFQTKLGTFTPHQKETVNDVKINPDLTSQQQEGVKQLV